MTQITLLGPRHLDDGLTRLLRTSKLYAQSISTSLIEFALLVSGVDLVALQLRICGLSLGLNDLSFDLVDGPHVVPPDGPEMDCERV